MNIIYINDQESYGKNVYHLLIKTTDSSNKQK